MDKLNILWNEIKSKLKELYDENTYLDLIENVGDDVFKFQNQHIYVIVKNEFTKLRINQLHLTKINNMAVNLYNDLVDFRFITQSEADEMNKQSNNLYNLEGHTYLDTNLNSNFTFSNFVVGKSNNYAYKIANIVADHPGEIHNPLYIFGGVGLGKTHLMQAIGNKIIERNLNNKIIYAKADEFIEDYKHFLDTKQINDFYLKYREVDVLLMDDIQMLSRANQSQNEFFKIFDRLKSANKQIVITSDCPPHELKDIMNRLTSRFQESLIIFIDAPDLSHRLTILKHELVTSFDPDQGVKVPEVCLNYIADNFIANIRELKGALKMAMTYCSTNNLEPTIVNFKEALSILISSKERTNQLSENNYDKVQSIVADYYSISVSDLIGTNRSSKFVLPRHIAMYLIKVLYDTPYKKIGEIFGNRDHSTILSACSKIDHDLRFDDLLKKAIDNLIKKISPQ